MCDDLVIKPWPSLGGAVAEIQVEVRQLRGVLQRREAPDRTMTDVTAPQLSAEHLWAADGEQSTPLCLIKHFLRYPQLYHVRFLRMTA
jgi:hypothetical protein